MGKWDRGTRNGWRIVGPALLVACGSAVPVAAQVAPARLASLPGAPAMVDNGLSLNATGEVLYDSNVLRSSVPTAFTTAHRDDFRYSPDLSATYGRSTGLLALTLNGLIGRDFFQYNRYLDRNRYVGGGSLMYHGSSSCQAGVNGTYSRRQAGIRDAGAAVVDPSGAPADDVGTIIDNVLTASTYGANAGCGSPTGRLTFGAGYIHSSLSNEAASRKFGDSDADTYSGNIGLGVLRPGQLSLNGSYTTIAYPNRLSAAPALGVPINLLNTGVKTYRIGVSFFRPIGTKLSGSLGVSYLHSDPTGGQGAYNSPAYTIALNYIPSQRLTFALTGSRDIVPSTTTGALFRVVDQVLLNATYSLGSSITVDGNVGFIGNNYKGGFAIPGEPLRRDDTTTSLGLGVTYAPRSLYDVTLNVTQSIRNSDPSIYNYNSTRVGLTLALHY